MKRIQPVSTYRAADAYPAVSSNTEEGPVTRRDFLRSTLDRGLAVGVAGAVTAGAVGGGGALAALVLGEDDAAARGKGSRAYHRVWFRLVRPHYFSGGRYSVARLLVQSRSKRLVQFVADPKERNGLDGVIRAVLAGATSADLADQKKLSRLNRKVGKAIAARYHARTRRRAPRTLVSLAIKHRRRPPLPGGLRPPHPPHLPHRP